MYVSNTSRIKGRILYFRRQGKKVNQRVNTGTSEENSGISEDQDLRNCFIDTEVYRVTKNFVFLGRSETTCEENSQTTPQRRSSNTHPRLEGGQVYNEE